jgi:hypothetical protein
MQDMRLALDDVMLADLECQPDNAAVAVIVGILSSLSS